MTKISLVIPYRENPNRPNGILPLCIRAWHEQTLRPDIIVADGSIEPVSLSLNIQSIHVPFEGPFNLSFLRNVGVRRALNSGSTHVQIMDADIFPSDKSYLARAFKELEFRKADMLMPYVVNCNETIQDFESINDAAYQRFINQDLNEMKVKRHSYSTLFMKMEVPKAINGWRCQFKCWGGEDDAFLRLAGRKGFRAIKLDQPILFHSFHERDTSAEAKKNGLYERNLELLKNVDSLKGYDDWGLVKEPRD